MKKSFYSIIRNRYINFDLIFKGLKCDLKTTFNCSDESTFEVSNSSFHGSNIYIRNKSKLILGRNCQVINSKIHLDKGSILIMGDNCKLVDASITACNNSEISFGNDCLVKSDKLLLESEIRVSSGTAYFGSNANVKGKVIVSSGYFKMGSNSFINYGSEIRCEEKVVIGDYVFISYFVDIFDTNTHSLDWNQRMQEVVAGYPNSTIKLARPITKPIMIGDSVWIGKNAAVLKGSNIGSKSIIGTRSVVTKSFPEMCVICGNPASLVKTLYQ